MEKKTGVSEEDVDKLMKVFGEMNCCDVWSKVQSDDFTVKRFAMGYVNDIACCELTPQARQRLCKSSSDCPGIVVKFAPEQLFFTQSRIEVVANNTIISQHNLSPRLIFIDDKCIINEYVQCRNYACEDDLDAKTVKQLARVLGQFHSLKSPISSKGFKTWEQMSEDIGKVPGAEDVFNKKYLEHLQDDPTVKEKYYSTFSELDLLSLMDYCKDVITKVKSPLVFTHGDFNRGNRLVKKVDNDDGTSHKEIYLVDFDYSTYNYRGYDISRYFSNYRHVDDMFGDEGFPSDQEMSLFLEEYRQECGRVQGDHYLDQKINSLEQLIKETKVFVLNAYTIDFFFCLMMYTLDPKSDKKHYFLQSSSNRYEAFKKAKQSFIDDGTLPSVLASNGLH